MTSLETKNCKIQYDAPIAPITTFRIGGCADAIAYPENASAFGELIRELCKKGIKHTVLGNGSNVLFCGERYDGVIVVTRELKNISVSGNTVTAECGASLTKTAAAAYEAGLCGLEFAYGIPGSIGGGTFMNAGAYGGCLSDVISKTVSFDENGEKVELSEHGFSYRDSVFQHKKLYVASASFELVPSDKAEIKAKMDDYMSRRKEKQPLDMPSAGSVFKRGNGFITSQVIDECGLKGLSVGGAEVSEKHAGFIVNKGGASSDDVLALIEKVKEKVFEMTGKTIECEVRLIK